MSEMKINSMDLSQFSDYMKSEHGHKKNLEKYFGQRIMKRSNGRTIAESYLIPATFEEVLASVIRGHELLKQARR